ncbi:multicopper oxidase [Neofusicoccum parvum]|nr:multicopper oxidase [Neofusicoccum parvum]
MDGVVGFTQHPILPGANFTYEFDIAEDQAGSFWYHAHNQVQRADGLFGGLIVHRPSIAGSPLDPQKYEYDEERLLLIGDWYHRSANEVLAWYMRAASFGNEPVPDSLLINGLGAYNCSKAVRARPVECVQHQGTAVPNLHFDRSKRYRLRLVNTGTLAGFTISITDAMLRVIEVDGGNPVSSSIATAPSVGILHPGQRTDVILSWPPDAAGESKLTITLDGEDFKYPNPALTRTQHFPISPTTNTTTPPAGAPNDQKPTSPPPPPQIDLSTLTSASPLIPPLPPTTTHTLLLYANTLKLSHRANAPHGYMNQTSWSPQATPPGLLTTLPRAQWDSNQLVPHLPFSHWVTIILNNLDDGAHPFHLHGHAVRVVRTRAALWNPWGGGGGDEGFELGRAVRRDTVVVPRRGHVVLRFEAGNAGVWMLHCHNLWHQASGMAMGIEVGGGGED